MKKLLIGIFAHPDDEAFGPAGTLLMETKKGAELHLVTLTAGENGANPDAHPDLGEIRLREWRASGELLGASSLHHLGFTDGTLNNLAYLKIVEQLIILIETLHQQAPDLPIELISMDVNGITGHIDHIVASRAAHHVFYTLRARLPLTRLRLACIPREALDHPNTDFVFMEPGRTKEEINEVIDARQYLDEIIAIIHTHHTQRQDGKSRLAQGEAVAINHFIVKT